MTDAPRCSQCGAALTTGSSAGVCPACLIRIGLERGAALTPGARLGPYEISGPIGAGGMGQVYKARDTRLERSVAIKVLPPALAADAEFRERFEREAKAISALDDPHICALYDVGEHNGAAYLVMQYLEGETLAARIERGPLPLADALKIAGEIAGALARAHAQGIVHRDLKPGNVMLTKSGAKLLDFGLAKASSSGAISSTDETTLQPAAQPLTTRGTILGTLAYMAPEQIEGHDADARADVFAFGAVLFEMVTGRKAFEGRTQASLLSAVLKDEAPRMSEINGEVPPALDYLIRTCLAKAPDNRFQSAHDLRLHLRGIAAEPVARSGVLQPVTAARAHGSKREMVAWIVAVLCGFAVAGLAAIVLRRSAPTPRSVTFDITAPENQPFNLFPGLLAISTDGRRLAFAAGPVGNPQLWVRDLDSLTARPLQGTDGALQPVWSPDGRYVAFALAGGKLRRADVLGGLPVTLSEQVFGLAAWSSEGQILYTDLEGRLQRIAAGGGPPTVATEVDKAHGEVRHFWPIFLPDGRRFIFLARNIDAAKSALCLSSLDSPTTRTRLLDVDSSVAYSSGYLLYQRDGTLMAQAFNERQGQLGPDAEPIAEGIDFNRNNGRAAFAASLDGTLVYRASRSSITGTLTWFDRTGKPLGTVGEPGIYDVPALSPDGHRLAIGKAGADGNHDIWVIDLDRDAAHRLTLEAGNNTSPVWSPDGTRVVFQSNRKGKSDLYTQEADGAISNQLLFEAPEFVSQAMPPSGFSRNGDLLLFTRSNDVAMSDVWALSMKGDAKPSKVIATPQREGNARFSPDGRWIA